MIRVAIFTSHPIQYQVPWFRALSRESELEVAVFFSYIPNDLEQGEGFGRKFQWDIPLFDGYRWSTLDSVRLPAPIPRYMHHAVRGVSDALREFNPDVAIVLGWHELSLVQALLECSRKRIPVVMRGEANALVKRPRFKSSLQRVLLRRCSWFLAIGAANARFYLDRDVPPERIAMARYFVDNARFSAQAENLKPYRSLIRAEWCIPATSVCFVFVGKLEPKKRPLDFIEAIGIASKSNPNIHGLVVGSGELDETARAIVERRALPISFAGFLNQSEIAKAYVAADALVLPSDFGETWGLVVNEAMACGVPTMVSDRVGCGNDLVVDGVTGAVFPFGDAVSIAAKMSHWAADEGLRATLSGKASKLVTEQYSLEQAIDVTRHVLRCAANANSGAH